MRASDIWRKSTGKGISVAVIDGGVNPSTPSLKGQVVKGIDVAGISGDETDDYDGHGTTMAELIAGTGKGGGIQGLAPGAKILPIRTLIAEMRDKEAPDRLHTLDKAIRAAADSDAQIINVSLGQDGWDDDTREAVQYAAKKGKVMFSSVGNEAKGLNYVDYPAAYPDVVGVAATNSEGRVASFSEHGDEVHLAAPGVKIPSWCDESFKRYCVSQGTSQASAIASASAALIWSAHPDWTANQVLRVMFESAGRGDDWKPGTVSNYLGHGIVRPNAAINRGIGKPGDPNLSPLTNEKTGGSTAPSAPASSQPPKPKPGSDATVAGSSKSTSDGGQLGLIIGIGAAVVIAVGAFAVVRKRRTV
ncbi:S8 family serine peptidase [Streptomyces sp. AM8-1-1]|uniref:S8 family serine peptidase n=1 Tax=Streptomyces sp. AM8-1-1 TaxID=3075825 RepID=UPI0028C3835A|nr:S8 family serine peptidase [Streptomyces sp. AM8-1-1]WNO77115.1 S8 family serine peptidase [Streptomyces sp. AM8-1-1]